jgi:hypothetical protein
MPPRKQLPVGYQAVYSLDLSKNLRVALWLNVTALALFLVFGWLFTEVSKLLRPDYWADGGVGILTGLDIVGAMLALVLMMILHEGIHGVFFWLFTHERPRFGLKLLYAYAAAPDWYLPRDQYKAVGLAPFIVITLASLTLLPVVPLHLMPTLLFLLTLNAGGSVGDFYVVKKISEYPAESLINDKGDSFTVYGAGAQF